MDKNIEKFAFLLSRNGAEKQAKKLGVKPSTLKRWKGTPPKKYENKISNQYKNAKKYDREKETKEIDLKAEKLKIIIEFEIWIDGEKNERTIMQIHKVDPSLTKKQLKEEIKERVRDYLDSIEGAGGSGEKVRLKSYEVHPYTKKGNENISKRLKDKIEVAKIRKKHTEAPNIEVFPFD